MPRRFLPPLLLLITALCWSLGGALIKSIDWPPMAIAGGRSAIAVPVILLCIGRPRLTFSRAQIGGALGYAATVILFVFATRMTTAANAIFLQYTAPIYVALIGRWYLNERASRIDWLVIAVALIGIVLFLRSPDCFGLVGKYHRARERAGLCLRRAFSAQGKSGLTGNQHPSR